MITWVVIGLAAYVLAGLVRFAYNPDRGFILLITLQGGWMGWIMLAWVILVWPFWRRH